MPIETTRNLLFDVLQIAEPRQWQPLPVVIVDIDEKSLTQYGQWPWPRNLIGDLVSQIAALQPYAIGFDILFAEPDRMSPNRLLDEYPYMDPLVKRAIANLETHDARLARSLTGTPSVLGVGAELTKAENTRRALQQTPLLETGGPAAPLLPKFAAAIQSLPILERSARSHGALNVLPEHDGVIRRVPLAINIDGTVTPTLTLEMLRVAFGAPNIGIHRDGNRISGMSVADVFIPTEADGRIWVNFTHPLENRYVSAADILDGGIALERIPQSFVLIGSTALGLVDRKAIPLAPFVDGIEVHAMLLESMLANELLTRPWYADRLELALTVGTGLFLILLVPFLKPRWAALPLTAVILLLCATAWAAHHFLSLRIDTSYAGLSDIAVFAILLAAMLVETERIRRALQKDLEVEREAAARVEGELEAARTIQLGILPSDFPAFPGHREFDLHAMLEPAKAVGGDLYDFGMLDDDHLFFIVGDVSGKGIPASLFMAITKALYKSSAMRRKVAVEAIMTEANAEISRENPAMMFVTGIAGIMDIRTGDIEFCNAGHDAPILLSPGKDPQTIEMDGGPPLCVLDDFEYPRDTHKLNPGESIVMFTDGVTEAMNPASDLYSMNRLVNTLAMASDGLSCAEIVKVLYDDVLKFADGAEPSDDVTILVLRYMGPGNTPAVSGP